MKKRLLMVVMSVCLIVPCIFLFSACNKEDEKLFNITIDNVSYIDIDSSLEQAKANEKITISYELTTGYELEYFLVNGEEISGNEFNMPEEDVVISASVKKSLYTVNIKLNNDSFGELEISNVNDSEDEYHYGKNDYEYGDMILIEITPNDGYYLRRYSDNTEINLRRYITITENINIEIFLEQGEACNYYGYNIAVHGDSENNFYHKEGNVTSNIKYFPNKTYNSGTLKFEISNQDLFSYFEFNYNTNKKMLFEDKINKEQLDYLYAENYDGSWIDVYEKDTRCGTIYSTHQESYLIEDSIPETGEFEFTVFNDHNPAWLFYHKYEIVGFTEMKSSNFKSNGTNAYIFNVEDLDSDNSINIEEYIIFTIGDDLYYRYNKEERIVKNANMFYSSSVDFTSVVNGVSYTLTFNYSE